MRKPLGLFTILFMMLFVSCGKEKERELGIDEYVYLADQVSTQGMGESFAWFCQEANGKLYYQSDAGLYPLENLMADSTGNLFYLEGGFSDARAKVLYQGTRERVELSGLPEMLLLLAT